jgi:isocitrate dehydrogenase (NAD+)
MTRHTVTLIPGDGIGPEVSAAARRVIDAAGAAIDWDVQLAGMEMMNRGGALLPRELIDSIKTHRVALKGPLTTPVGGGFRSVNVALRRELDLYALVRPCRWYPGVRSRHPGLDLVVIRENTEDLYAGIEFQAGQPETLSLIETVRALGGGEIDAGSGVSLKPISEAGAHRILRFAFAWARANGRLRVTVVHKANIMKFTDGLWLDTARHVAVEYPELTFDERIVDNMAMQLVQCPEVYDVIVAPNLYGDILSDLCAGLVGGLGVAPGANMGDGIAVFEATHGSAPDIAGKNVANPMAMMLSGVMMLRHLGEEAAARKLNDALMAVISQGQWVTADMKPFRGDSSAVGTAQMADAVSDAMEAHG